MIKEANKKNNSRKKTMAENEDMNRYMAMIEYYKEQMQQIEMQLNYVQTAINDYNRAKITLDNFIKSEKGADVLLPIGGSTFVHAKADDTSKVLFDIGNGIVTEKKTDEAIKKIDERIEDLNKTFEKLNEMGQQIQNEANEATMNAQKLMGQG